MSFVKFIVLTLKLHRKLSSSKMGLNQIKSDIIGNGIHFFKFTREKRCENYNFKFVETTVFQFCSICKKL